MRRALAGVVLVCVLVAVLFDAAAGARGRHLPRHKFAVKTIQSEDGDIIDCVDVYKQPSLEHLSSENRTNMQIFRSRRPSSTSNLDPSKKPSKIQQRWQKSGSCPEGTIPILRITPSFRSGTNDFGLSPSVERAVAFGAGDGPFRGAKAMVQRWKIYVEPNEYSMSYITLMTGSNPDVPFFGDLDVTEFVRVGIMVHPAYFLDNEARFFVQWSNDNGATTGCFNLDCSGFVHTNPQIALGAVLLPPSVYDDPARQPAIALDIYQDSYHQRWYVEVNDEEVGYWPTDGLFKNLHVAPWVTWGGEILNTWPGGQHTITQMGNGRPAEEGHGRAATMFDLLAWETDEAVHQYNPAYYQDRPGCYGSAYQGYADDGVFFSFGGSGGADCLFHGQKIPKIN